MEPHGATPSPALLAANERLLARRAEVQRVKSAPATAGAAAVAYNKEEASPSECSAELPDLSRLPAHLGWGSAPLSQALRRIQQPETTDATTLVAPPPVKAASEPASNEEPAAPATAHDQPGVKLYPDIGLAMLREETTSTGRLWLLLRELDPAGRGCFRVANIKALITKKSSPTYLCGWRQVRNLLREGEGVYWTITPHGPDGRAWLWLRSAAKVAYNLGVERLTGRPVALSLESLVNGIGRFRAELYAAFHSGRVKLDPKGQPQPAPIARETLTNLSGVGETTQRRYETAVNLDVEPNYAIGNKVNKEELEEKGWAQGQALFVLEDFNGQQGPKGRQYVAWQLPNSYTGSHQQRPQGRQRRINRQLKDLVMKGMPGNEGRTEDDSRMTKLYYPTGKLAAQAFNRRKVERCYWQRNGRSSQATSKRYGLWHQLEVKGR
jgi:hypothetical protein